MVVSSSYNNKHQSNASLYHFSLPWYNTHNIVPPSPPQNVSVVNSTDDAITLTWEIPEFDGGRGRVVYGLYYQANDGVMMKVGTVSGTTGVVRGIAMSFQEGCMQSLILIFFAKVYFQDSLTLSL